jgi:hypothetical protein
MHVITKPNISTVLAHLEESINMQRESCAHRQRQKNKCLAIGLEWRELGGGADLQCFDAINGGIGKRVTTCEA